MRPALARFFLGAIGLRTHAARFCGCEVAATGPVALRLERVLAAAVVSSVHMGLSTVVWRVARRFA